MSPIERIADQWRPLVTSALGGLLGEVGFASIRLSRTAGPASIRLSRVVRRGERIEGRVRARAIDSKVARSALVVLFALSVVLHGCGGTVGVAKDKAFARKLLDAAYAGSFKPIENSLHRTYKIQMPDYLTAALGESLRAKYGKVKDIELQSTRTAKLEAAEGVWAVQGERGSYDMKIVFNSDGKVIYLAFRRPSQGIWQPAALIAHEYIREQTKGQPT